jgi:hypothetical protein
VGLIVMTDLLEVGCDVMTEMMQFDDWLVWRVMQVVLTTDLLRSPDLWIATRFPDLNNKPALQEVGGVIVLIFDLHSRISCRRTRQP